MNFEVGILLLIFLGIGFIATLLWVNKLMNEALKK